MNKAYTAGLITYANKKQRVGIITTREEYFLALV